MPLYTYRCVSCGYVFEELVSYEKRDEEIPCEVCKGSSTRNAAERFGISGSIDGKTTVYTPKEIDKVVGEKAEKKWAAYDERWKQRYSQKQKERWKGRTPEPVQIPKESDGKYSPLMHLGDNKQKEIRKEFSTALQEHRSEREKKGLKQFDAPGAIIQD